MSVQKFFRLLAEGFAIHKQSCSIQSLGSIPITPANHKKKIWVLPQEVHAGVKYTYIPRINILFVNYIGMILCSFFQSACWILKRLREDRIVICDPLKITITLPVLLASKLLQTKIIAIVTDIPQHRRSGLKISSFQKTVNILTSKAWQHFDGYIILTEQMNNVINTRHKPYMVMEGLVDKRMDLNSNQLKEKTAERILFYAGAIYKEYGIETLIEAFIRLEPDDIQLHIYGSGEMSKYMPNYMKRDRRIVYHGTVPNKTVVAKELQATLLINPRFSTENYTRYSFPSKNMEYMVSGTPVVTTPLPGMPKEYNKYVYLFQDESVEGMYQTLNWLLSKPREELHEFGKIAKDFVLTHKNNKIQSKKILSFIEHI